MASATASTTNTATTAGVPSSSASRIRLASHSAQQPTQQLLPVAAFWPPTFLRRRKTRIVAVGVAAPSKSPSRSSSSSSPLLDCKRFVGAPLTRDQARAKLETNRNFQELVLMARAFSIPTTAATSNKNINSTTTAAAAANREGVEDLVDQAVALEYGTRLRACFAETTRSCKIKHRTPY